MSDAEGSKESTTPRLCERCGSRMSPQKRGRPRRWCSQQCRQLAYEERHGLESWADKQPKANDLSDVVKAMSERGFRREASRLKSALEYRPIHSPDGYLNVVGQDLILMTMIVEKVVDITRRHGVINSPQGRLLGNGVVELVDVVLLRSMAVVPVEECPGINAPTPEI